MRNAVEVILPLVLMLLAACGRGEEKPRLTPEEQLEQEAGISPLPVDTAVSLLGLRPPIDDYGTPYLFPHEHPDLPEHIADWLSERGYVIPQDIPKENWDEFFPINVMIGEFEAPGQSDVAVYCTNKDTTGIILFWHHDTSRTDLITRYPATEGSSLLKGSKIQCCYEYIRTKSPESIYQFYSQMKKFGEPEPPSLDHDGIIIGGVLHSASVVIYKSDGLWYLIKSSE